MSGLNVDPTNLSGRPDPALLKRQLGVTWVRLVSRDSPEVHDYANQAHSAGIRVLATVARESAGYLLPDADMYQIGNEPDQTGPSSWTMTPDQYVEEWRIYRESTPLLPMIAAGLASGNVAWWQSVAPRLDGCAAVAVHPYNKTATQARILLRAYRNVRPSLALWVTEWFRDPDQIVPFGRMLVQEADNAFWFCSSDGMVDGMGLFASDGSPRPHSWYTAALAA